MNRRFSTILVFSLIIMMFLVSCTQGGGDSNTFEGQFLGDESFLILKGTEALHGGSIIVINSEEDFQVGNAYRIKVEEQITKSLPPIANAIEVEDLGPSSSSNIDFDQAKTINEQLSEKTHIIDVRTNEEFSEGHVPGAINIPLDTLESDFVDSYDRDDIFILYCRSGNRSAQGAKVLEDNGYKVIFNAGGINSYNGELE